MHQTRFTGALAVKRRCWAGDLLLTLCARVDMCVHPSVEPCQKDVIPQMPFPLAIGNTHLYALDAAQSV